MTFRHYRFTNVSFLFLCFLALAVFQLQPAFAQYLIGPGGPPPTPVGGTIGGAPGPAGLITDIKTPALRAGDTIPLVDQEINAWLPHPPR